MKPMENDTNSAYERKLNLQIQETMKKYGDIIHLPHHVSRKHPQMSLNDRAAQFSPFAALTGYGEKIKEAERYIEEDE